jgi:hypothetical protein
VPVCDSQTGPLSLSRSPMSQSPRMKRLGYEGMDFLFAYCRTY